MITLCWDTDLAHDGDNDRLRAAPLPSSVCKLPEG